MALKALKEHCDQLKEMNERNPLLIIHSYPERLDEIKALQDKIKDLNLEKDEIRRTFTPLITSISRP
jgi:chromosome segregation ATPase